MVMKINTSPLIKYIVKLRMFYADLRGHRGKHWNYEPSEYYLGMRKSKRWKDRTTYLIK